MDSLQSILPKVLAKRGLKSQATASQITFLAEAWLKRTLPTGCREVVTVKTLTHATLTVACGHSIALQECQQLVPMLLDYLRKECKSVPLEDVRLLRSAMAHAGSEG